MNEAQKQLYGLEKQQGSMLLFDNYFLRGLLKVKGEPLYIAEYHTGGGPDVPRSIAVYDVTTETQPDGTKYYDKKYVTKTETHSRFKNTTLLSKLAGADAKVEKTTHKEYELPIFVTTIEPGVDTFSKHKGDGFWEHERGRFDTSNGSYEPGDKTGVFICLDSFKWADAHYRFSDVREALNDRY